MMFERILRILALRRWAAKTAAGRVFYVAEPLEGRRLLSAVLTLDQSQTIIAGGTQDATAFAGTGGSDAEMLMAVNPLNPLNVVGFTWNTSYPRVLRSVDGGATWGTPLNIDGTVEGFGEYVYSRFDPSLAFDADGNLFIGYIENY